MTRQVLVALIAGIVFGAGLAVSGMSDPMRVRAFLDVAGNWDPTLAFVISGALLPMIVAWRIQARLKKPVLAAQFHLPVAQRVDVRLLGGAAIFGLGWGIAGVCPGAAIADLFIMPSQAALFVVAMLGGMGLRRLTAKPLPAAKTAVADSARVSSRPLS